VLRGEVPVFQEPLLDGVPDCGVVLRGVEGGEVEETLVRGSHGDSICHRFVRTKSNTRDGSQKCTGASKEGKGTLGICGGGDAVREKKKKKKKKC